MPSLYEPIVLAASAARTATGTGDPVDVPRARGQVGPLVTSLTFVLNLTAAAADAQDTLDVTVQMQLDGTNWLDVAHFTQCLGNGGAKRYVTKIAAAAAQAEFEVGTALTATNVRNLIGPRMRGSWTVVDSGDHDQSFTFSLVAVAL